MVRKQILKRASYIGAAIILMLAAVPIVPGRGAYAEDGSCINKGYKLQNWLKDETQESEAVICSGLTEDFKASLTIDRDVTIDLNGQTLLTNVVINAGKIVTFKNGTLAGLGQSYTIFNRGGILTLEDVNVTVYGAYDALRNESGVATINGGTYAGKINATGGSVTIEDGEFNAVLAGSVTAKGGKYHVDPADFLAGDKDAYAFEGYWMVGDETTITMSDAIVPVGTKVEIGRVSGPEYNTLDYVVKNSAGADASADVAITSEISGNEKVIYAVGTAQGRKEIDVISNSGKTAHATLRVYNYLGVDDKVIFKGENLPMEISSNKWNVQWSLTKSSDESIATVNGHTVTAVASGKATVTARFNDTVGSEVTFDVYVYDFDAEDNLPLLIKKGSSAVVSTDSYWDVAASPDNAVASTVKGGEGKFTVNGLSVGETEFTFSSTVNGTDLSKKIKVYVYDVEEDEIWVEKGQTVNYDGIKLDSDDVEVEVVSGNAEIANATTTAYAVEGKSAGDVTLTYKLRVATRIVEIPVTVHVYSVNAKTSATIVEGTEVDFTNAAIATIENPNVVTVKIKEGGEYISADTTANGKLATNAKGTAVIEFYAGETKVGETEIKVYALQDLRDIVLSITGTGANISEVIDKLNDVNLPEYRISIADNSVANVRNENEWSWHDWAWHTTGHRISARGAGKTTATVTYKDSLGETTQTFDVLVSDYATRDVRGTHDVAQGGEVKFMISELYDQNSVSYEDDLGFEISHDERGEYIVRVPADMAGGEYTLKFTDKVGNVEIARQDIVIRVHEITASQDELFIKKDGEAGKVTVNEKNGFAPICKNVWHWDFLWWGHNEYECNIEITDASGAASNGITVNATEDSDEYEIVVNEAGEYKVTFSDGVASKTITVYAIDFTVDKTEYHLVKGDNAPKLVKAINKYWNETNADTINGFEVTKKVNSDTDYYFWPTDAEAGKYAITFYAKIGDKIVDQKTVDIYLYEMVAPEEAEYFGRTGSTFSVHVGDKNEHAYTRRSVDGPAGGLVFFGDTVVAFRAGTYTVTYTDYMKDGSVVGTYTATFTIFNVEHETVLVESGKSAELAPHSDWDTDSAVDNTAGEDLNVENGKTIFEAGEDVALGMHQVALTHNFREDVREVVKNVTVVVYSVEADPETDPEGVTADTLKEYIEGIFKDSNTWEEFVEKVQKSREIFGDGFEYLWSTAGVNGAVFGGDKIETRVEVTELSEEDVDAALIETIEGLDVDNVEYFDVSVWMSRNGYDFGKMHQLNGKITVALTEVTDPETGYARQYIVVRQHAGEEPEILVEGVDFYIEDGVLYVISDKFSTFVVAYKDTLLPVKEEVVYTVTAPNTGENTANEGGASVNLSVAVIAAIAAVTLAGAVVFAKRK